MMTKAEREAYIRASHSRIAKWSKGKREHCYSVFKFSDEDRADTERMAKEWLQEQLAQME